MPRRTTLLPALAAAAALSAPVSLAVTAPAVATPAPAASPVPRAADAPLSLTIDALTPSSIPRSGKVKVSGWVTNDSDETWTAVNVHAFIGAEPITSSNDLAFESTAGFEESVGDRITVPGTFDTIPELAPGARAPYTDRIPVARLDADSAGVYWFGVHALGSSAAGRDAVADGRARTFLPYVPAEDRPAPIATSLVLPVRHQVTHDPDGTLADEEGWADTLGDGGQLSSILDFGLAAGGRPLTWLIDPAVPDAADRIDAGNPPRQLVVREAVDEGTEPPSDGASGSSAPLEPAPDEELADIAEAWLVKLNQAVTGKQVLALPWGDVDVAAAAKRDTDVYTDARARSGSVLNVNQAAVTPAMAAPSGYLDDAALALADDATTVLISDRAVARGQAPSVASYAGRKVIFYSDDVLDGGPGPDDPLAPVAMRQRILSEAAVRLNEPGRRPLVVVFPPSWSPPSEVAGSADYAEFFAGLDVNWLQLSSLADATTQPGRPLSADRFSYPPWQVNHEVDDAAFNALADLTEEARRLQGVISVENDLAARVRVDALGNLSYFARLNATRSRLATLDTTGWVRARLGSISISGPRQVILSSNSGPFSVTITNGLEEPVSVQIRTTSNPPMTITSPDTLQLPASSTTTRVLEASTDKLGVHDVTISVTDAQGKPLGSPDQLPIRAAQVSEVIWLIMGGAVALLLIAIVLRVVRRIRGGGTHGDDDPGAPPGSTPGSAEIDEPHPEPAAPAR